MHGFNYKLRLMLLTLEVLKELFVTEEGELIHEQITPYSSNLEDETILIHHLSLIKLFYFLKYLRE